MENNNDVIEVKIVEDNIVILVNNKERVKINEKNNRIELKNIFDNLTIRENYKFELIIGNETDNKNLNIMFKYVRSFFNDLHTQIEKIEYPLHEDVIAANLDSN